jgi:anti-sigma factor RsiW
MMTSDNLTCQTFIDLVTAYLDDQLPERERRRFEAHLEDCPYCTAYLEQMRQTIRLVGRLSEASLAPEIKSGMLHRFRDWTSS